MPRRVVERPPIAAARHVEHAPERLARHADDQVRLGQTREHAKGPGRIVEMLQDLAAHHQLGAIEVGRQRVQIGDAEAHGQTQIGGARSQPGIG